MTNSAASADKIFVHEHYAIHYRRAARTVWTGEARPVYAALFVLGGEMRWRAGESERALREPGLLVAAPGESVTARGAKVESLALTVSPAFVLAEYFGYLRRDADAGGFNFWLSKLEQFGGNFIRAEMVKAFITSIEYRQRFAP